MSRSIITIPSKLRDSSRYTMEVYTHRGIGLGPENTDAAFRSAVALRVSIEADIGRTSNGTLVFMHDDTVDRTTNGTGQLREKTDKEVALLSAGMGHGKAYKNERIPHCRASFARYPETEWILDLKDDIGEEVLELVTAADLLEQVRFNGEDLNTLNTIKKKEPRARVGLVTENISPKQIPYLARTGIDYLSPWIATTPRKLVTACHDNGLQIIPWFSGEEVLWTPAMRNMTLRVMNDGVDGLIVNHPRQVLDLLKRRAPANRQVYPSPQQAA